jgi:hypothetical protein
MTAPRPDSSGCGVRGAIVVGGRAFIAQANPSFIAEDNPATAFGWPDPLPCLWPVLGGIVRAYWPYFRAQEATSGRRVSGVAEANGAALALSWDPATADPALVYSLAGRSAFLGVRIFLTPEARAGIATWAVPAAVAGDQGAYTAGGFVVPSGQGAIQVTLAFAFNDWWGIARTANVRIVVAGPCELLIPCFIERDTSGRAVPAVGMRQPAGYFTAGGAGVHPSLTVTATARSGAGVNAVCGVAAVLEIPEYDNDYIYSPDGGPRSPRHCDGCGEHHPMGRRGLGPVSRDAAGDARPENRPGFVPLAESYHPQ